MQDKVKSAVKTIAEIIESLEPLTNKKLIEICRANGIELIGSQNEAHLIHELLETGVNLSIVKSFSQANLLEKTRESQTLDCLSKLLENCPPQSWRGEEQLRLQQFSTPPTIAYLMAKILKPLPAELVLEPSAGTGSLAAWLKVAGCRIHVNELSEMRRVLLELQGYTPTGFDAEFLDDLLPEKIEPDAVLMNPPFSSSGGRTKTNDSNFGFGHVRSALLRLKTGGRLVALMGTESATKTEKGRKFWREIAAEYDLRAIIHLPKNAFYKYGTSIGTTLVCVAKNQPTESANRSGNRKNVLETSCETLHECLKYADIFN
ncbi:MAG: SAM-dependent methyltransferase [Acidobacteriota bacterium]|nr:SAM-dependent methyltransferase [Acidobacteriota bacterium]